MASIHRVDVHPSDPLGEGRLVDEASVGVVHGRIRWIHPTLLPEVRRPRLLLHHRVANDDPHRRDCLAIIDRSCNAQVGWILLAAGKTFFVSLPADVLILIVVGGVLYSLGVIFYLWEK